MFIHHCLHFMIAKTSPVRETSFIFSIYVYFIFWPFIVLERIPLQLTIYAGYIYTSPSKSTVLRNIPHKTIPGMMVSQTLRRNFSKKILTLKLCIGMFCFGSCTDLFKMIPFTDKDTQYTFFSGLGYPLHFSNHKHTWCPVLHCYELIMPCAELLWTSAARRHSRWTT